MKRQVSHVSRAAALGLPPPQMSDAAYIRILLGSRALWTHHIGTIARKVVLSTAPHVRALKWYH